MDLISKEELEQFIKIEHPGKKKLVDFIFKKLKIDELNSVYDKHKSKESVQFVQDVLSELQISFSIKDEDIKRIPSKGGFILLSNHPFGALDGLIICKIISEKRPDFKLMANFLLQRIEPIKDQIFPVNPFENMKDKKSSVNGVKSALSYVQDGHPLAIFPAGEVASFKWSKLSVLEKEWDQTVKFILKCNVPVVPVFISGSNSPLFHMLGMIHPMLRTAKLPSELFNKTNEDVRLRIGHPIEISDLVKLGSNTAISSYLQLKSKTLSNSFPVDAFFKRPLIGIKKKVKDIDGPQNPADLLVELNQLPNECKLFISGSFELFVVKADQVPKLMLELGRLRELTFRAIGEGTNKELDLDPFDVYYHHLIIWDSKLNLLVGAYRMGKGDEIIDQFGLKGFYVNTLFKLDIKDARILSQSIELGRTFIRKEYQKKPTTLFVLWKGILFFMEKNPSYRYLIGPVSISNSFSSLSKGLLVSFSDLYLKGDGAELYGKPRNKFKITNKNKLKINNLLPAIGNDFDKLDKLIQEIDKDQCIPVLLKKYIGMNAKLIAFNVDPLFNNCLDGFIYLDLGKLPSKFKSALSKD